MINAKPHYIAYSVSNGSEEKARWTRIGAAFAHKDAAGFDIVLDALPVTGRIVLREPKENTENKAI